MKKNVVKLAVRCLFFLGLGLCDNLGWAADDFLTLKPRPEPYGRSLCYKPGFKCINLPSNSNWYQLFPNPAQREIVRRLNRTNVSLRYRKWLLLPVDWQHFDYMDAGPFLDHITPLGEKLLVVDLRVFAFAAYNAQGYLVYWGPASGGQDWCDDVNRSCKTVDGSYRIYRIQGPDCISNEFPAETKGGDSMPYCMHYYRGYAIHGSTLTGFVNRSHGCVRLFDDDAQWLNEHFVQMGTKVIVKR